MLSQSFTELSSSHLWHYFISDDCRKLTLSVPFPMQQALLKADHNQLPHSRGLGVFQR